jgi:POT family proton-dependent oligopeptide transporter
MEQIKGRKYELNILWLTLSKFFERCGYYGIRSILFLYMIQQLMIDQQDTAVIYGFFTGLIGVGYLIGGVVGDLLLGSKLATIIGSGTMALGAFCLSVPDVNMLYLGLFLIIIGGGLFGPNSLSLISQSHQNNLKTLDGSFTLFNFAINLGSFLGVMAVSVLALNNYALGFAISGTAILVSGILTLFVKEPKVDNRSFSTNPIGTRTILIIGTVLMSGIFWVIYELSGGTTGEISLQLSQLPGNPLPTTLMTTIPTVLAAILAVTLFIIWTFVYIKPLIKIGFGLLIAAVSFLFILNFPQQVGSEHLNSFLAILFLLALVEVLISPSVFTIIALNSSPKFQGIIFAASFLPSRIFSIALMPLIFKLNINLTSILVTGIILLVLIGIVVLTLGFVLKENVKPKPNQITDALDL